MTASSQPQLDTVLNVLHTLGCKASRRPEHNGWSHHALCPAHEDHTPSLHIGQDRDGGVMLKCFAGCSTEAILESLGLQKSDLFPRNPSRDGRTTRRERLVAAYDYRDEDGEVLFQVRRYNPKRFLQFRPDGAGGYVLGRNGARLVPYRLRELMASDGQPVHIPEGEQCVDCLIAAGLVATCNPGGALKWRAEYAEFLSGRDVVVLPDNDEVGGKHASEIAKALLPTARSVKVVELPGLLAKGDIVDWLADGHTVEELKALAAKTPVLAPDDEAQEGSQGESAAGTSPARRVVEMVEALDVELFTNETGETFARVPIQDHWEIWPTGGRLCRQWLARLIWQEERKALGSEAIRAAVNVLEAKARFEGVEHVLANRVARHQRAIWYDLADPAWRCIRIDPGGWRLVARPPALFRRYAHQRPQVEPILGGDLHDLLTFVNVLDDADQLLLLVYTVSCLVPDIAHPLPVLHGPQGAAKTTLFRMLRRIVDPSTVETLSIPRDATELVQQLAHHLTAFYDNLSDLRDWTSDALARACTGEGFSKRLLYSDDDDVYSFRRCVGLNGINVVARKPDLLDRTILIGLETIEPARRIPERRLWEEFEQRRPALVGAAFDALSRAMRIRPSVGLTSFPRMADFAEWGCAIAEALGHSRNEFLAAYERNASARNDEVIQSHPVAAAVVAWMDHRQSWRGTATELLQFLKKTAEDQGLDTRAQLWPKAAQALTTRLNEIRPNLAAAGIRLCKGRTGSQRTTRVWRETENSVTSDTAVTRGPTGAQATTSGEGLCDATEPAPPGASLAASQPNSKCHKANDAGDADDATSRPLPAGESGEHSAVTIEDGGVSEAEAAAFGGSLERKRTWHETQHVTGARASEGA